MKTSSVSTPPEAINEKEGEIALRQQELATVERAIRDYVDGWYEGAAGRMTRALHPALAKRAFLVQPSGECILDSTSATEMIALTHAGVGKKKARAGQENEVFVLDLVENMATAKSISPDYIDLLHLVKLNGEWRIVNVLWAPNLPLSIGPKPQ